MRSALQKLPRLRLAIGVAALGAACATAPQPQPEPEHAAQPLSASTAPDAGPRPSGTGIFFKVAPADAQVVVDGVPRGVVSSLRDGLLALTPGLYRVSLQREGFHPWRAEVTVGNQPEHIDVTLEAR